MAHKTSDFENYGSDHLTFDCPWCGAISGIDPSHKGESFECPECKKATKLTPGNTRKGHLTDAPPDAPHLTEEEKAKKKAAHETSAWENYGRDHLTFDCPWCGAISGVDPSHLGEHYNCPECHKGTKLTEGTTRKGEIAEPAADAPHHEESTSRKLPLVLGIGILAVVAVIIAVVSSTPSDDGDGEGQPVTTTQQPMTTAQQPVEPGTEPMAAPPSDTEQPEPSPGPAAPAPTDEPGATPPADEPSPTEPPPTDAPPVAPPPEEAPPADPPPSAVQEAEAVLAAARARLESWEAANPGAAHCLRLSTACGEVTEEIRRLLGEMDPAAATVAEARAYDEAMHTYIAAAPNRVRVAMELMDHLNTELIRSAVLGSWETLNFFEPHVRETLLRLHDAMCTVDPTEYEALLVEVSEAGEVLAAAKAGDGAED